MAASGHKEIESAQWMSPSPGEDDGADTTLSRAAADQVALTSSQERLDNERQTNLRYYLRKWRTRLLILAIIILRLTYKYFKGGGNYLVGIEKNPGPPKRSGAPPQPVAGCYSNKRSAKGGGKGKGKTKEKAVINSLIDEISDLRAKEDVESSEITRAKEKSENQILKEKIERNQLERDLKDDGALHAALIPILPPSDFPNVGGSAGALATLRRKLVDGLGINSPAPYLIVLGELPRALWPHYIPENDAFVRPGIVPGVMNFLNFWDPYELVEKVELVAVPFAAETTQGRLPWRDRTSEKVRDVRLLYYQPLLRLTLGDGGIIWKKGDYHRNNGDPGGGWFTPRPNIQVIRQNQYFCRVRLEDDPHLGHIFEILAVSEYLLSELYSRRILLTPKLSKSTAIERLIRFAAEDPCVSAHLELLRSDVNVLRHTISFLTGVVSKDMTSALEDF